MRVIVTGGAGFIGSHLCRALLARGDRVVAIDNLLTGNIANIEELFGNPEFTFMRHDVSSYVHVPGPVDAVLHFASPASPADFERIPIQILKVGSLGTHHMLGLAKDKGARFFLASTSEVYGDPQVHPQPETYWGHVNPIGPRGVYDEAKRFAEAMTFAYHRAHGVDVRVARIFNSILADEQVLVDDGVQLIRARIGELASSFPLDTDLEGVSAPAFGQGARVMPFGVRALVGHPPTGPCYEVRTRYGRSIRVTGDHSIFVRGKHGMPVPKTVSALSVGDRVAIAGRINVIERDRIDVRVADLWEKDGGDPWDLAATWPELGNALRTRRHELKALAATSWRSSAADQQRAYWSFVRSCLDRNQAPVGALNAMDIAIPDHAMVFLARKGGRQARLPNTVQVTNEFLWLLGLFVAEGTLFEKLPKSSVVSISCDRPTLKRAAKIVERDLNLHVAWGESRGVAAIYLHSRVLVALMRSLGFSSTTKNIPGWILGLPLDRLKWFIEGYREGDGVHSGAKFDAAVRHEFSTIHEDLKNDLVVAFGRFGLVPSVGRYETTFKSRTGDRRYPFWRLTLANVSPWSPLEWDWNVKQRLNAARTGDVVWANVTSIEEIAPTGLVYDFCVPGVENFIAGSGVFAHNTFGPRMRPDDGRVVTNLLVQGLTGKPLTVYGDGTQTRSFCFVDDEVRGLLALLDSDYVGPVNIGNPVEYTVNEFAQIALEVTGNQSEIVHEPLPIDDPLQRQPDITLARSILGWEPTIDLREGLSRTAEYFRTVLSEDGAR